jgi:hypothetical protein
LYDIKLSTLECHKVEYIRSLKYGHHNFIGMGKATDMASRQGIIRLKQAGKTLFAISQELLLPYSTVRNLWQGYRTNPKKALAVNYANCGKHPKTRQDLIYRASLWIKRLHPQWGTPKIHLALCERYGRENVEHIRTLQRWYRDANLIKPRQQMAEPIIGDSKAVHNIWQVDAKERLTLLNGQEACYLTIVDEKSGAALEAPVFPLRSNQPSSY